MFEPAFADLREAPGGVAYGALLSVDRTALPALRTMDGASHREECSVKALTYDGCVASPPSLRAPRQCATRSGSRMNHA